MAAKPGRGKGKRKAAAGDVASNRRASHKFELIERFEAGIELRGSEVKALREGKAQIGDAYAVIADGEVWLRNAHIPPYGPAAMENHDPERPRKLLLHRHEIAPLFQGAAGEGRARPGPRQGAARPPARDPRPRGLARDRARGPRPAPIIADPAISVDSASQGCTIHRRVEVRDRLR